MRGWIVPPPKEPTKSSEAFKREREELGKRRPYPARTVILSFMSLSVWTEAINFSRLALAQAMALQLPGKSSVQKVWWYPLRSIHSPLNLGGRMIEQLKIGGRLISPVIEDGIQNLVLIEKGEKGIRREVICEVLYVSLRGSYGVSRK